jgi:hypothetical protein
MIKAHLVEFLGVVLIAIISVLAAGRPMVDRNPRSSVSDKKQLPDAKKQEIRNVQKEIVRDIVSSDVLKERNIFAPDGKYPILTPAGVIAGPSPANPKPDTITYTLMGVLDGEEKKAILRESTGSIVAITEGKKLKDGSVITRIDKFAVEMKKGEEKSELRIFSVKVPPLRRPAPG